MASSCFLLGLISKKVFCILNRKRFNQANGWRLVTRESCTRQRARPAPRVRVFSSPVPLKRPVHRMLEQMTDQELNLAWTTNRAPQSRARIRSDNPNKSLSYQHSKRVEFRLELRCRNMSRWNTLVRSMDSLRLDGTLNSSPVQRSGRSPRTSHR